MKTVSWLLLTMFLAAQALYAAPPAPPSPSKDKGRRPVPNKPAANKNTGNHEDDFKYRDPFWPIRYVPRKKVETPTTSTPNTTSTQSTPTTTSPTADSNAAWSEAVKLLEIEGFITRGETTKARLRHVGIIEAGNVISVRYGGKIYQWKVTFIEKDGKIGLKPVLKGQDK